MNIPAELISLLKQEKIFFIAAHMNPDGDTLGSSIALSLALEALGKQAVLYDTDTVPELYRFLPGYEKFSSLQEPQAQISTLILIDCNDPERAGLKKVTFPCSVIIDHHETVNGFGDVKWINPEAAATGLMVYYLIKELGVKITKDMAANLYAAIAVDTGTFRYSNTNADTLRVAAELVALGAEPALTSVALYETWSERRFRLFIMALGTMDMTEGIAFMHVTKEMFEQTGTTMDDTEGFTIFPRKIKDAKAVAFFIETSEKKWRVSLRSRGMINMSAVAEAFNGGGHKNAAGYKIQTDLRTAKELLLKTISSQT